MKRAKLEVAKRKVFGKKVKNLRKQGILPANIYGKDIKSEAVQVPFKDFEKVLKVAGETGLVDLQVDSQVRPVLIHNVQYDHLNNIFLHADFYQVNLKEKVKTKVAVSFIGTPLAVTDKKGVLLEQLKEVEVEALPTDLPENIEVNVENLANVDDRITIAELKLPQGVTVHNEASQVVAKIGELVTKEAQELAAQEVAAAEAAKAAAAEAAGEGVVEGVPAEEAPAEGAEAPAEEDLSAQAGKPAEEKPATTEPQKQPEAQKKEKPKQ